MKNSRFYFQIREYLSFTRGERNGIVILMMLILLVLACRIYLPYFNQQNPLKDTVVYEKDISVFAKKFKPDSLKVNARFTHKDQRKTDIGYVKKTRHQVDLNKVDSAELTTLPGIGPVFAGRIIKYRKRLGGFASKGQLLEVYGIKVGLMDQLTAYLKADSLDVIKIALNSATFLQINAHPYISFEQSKAIMRYRRLHKLNSVADLVNSGMFSGTEVLRIRPYLQF